MREAYVQVHIERVITSCVTVDQLINTHHWLNIYFQNSLSRGVIAKFSNQIQNRRYDLINKDNKK